MKPKTGFYSTEKTIGDTSGVLGNIRSLGVPDPTIRASWVELSVSYYSN